MALSGASPLPRTLAAPRRLPVRATLGLALAVAAMSIVFSVNRSSQPQTVAVLCAAHDVPVGAVLRTDDLEVVRKALPDDVAATLVPASERDAVVGTRVGQPLNAGELVSRRQI